MSIGASPRARLPNRFQAMCVSDVTATSTRNADGSVKVVNRCREADGSFRTSEGRATLASGDDSGARLKVSFLPSWLQWLPDERWTPERSPSPA